MNRSKLSFLILFSSFTALGQSSTEQILKLNIGMQGVDFTYELPIANQILIDSSASLGLGMSVIGTTTNYNFYLLDPVLSVATGLKWMYSYNKRTTNKKNTLNNAANYIGVKTKDSFGHTNTLNLNRVLLTDVNWGAAQHR